MADSLITKLSTLPQLRVLPTEDIRKYAKAGADPLAAGHELGVDVLLGGMLERSGDRMHVSVGLTRLRDERLLWGNEFNAPFTEIFKVQGFILEQVLRELRLELTDAQKRRLVQSDATSPAAYDLYERGRYYTGQNTNEGRRQALACYEEALEKDPSYALAYAGLGCALVNLGNYKQLPRAQAYGRARTALTKALALDETCARAHYWFGIVKLDYEWDWGGAESAFRRAIELWPNVPTPHSYYSRYVTRMARFEEGIAEAKKAIELAPHARDHNTILTTNLLLARRYDEALDQLRKTQDLYSKSDPGPYLWRGRAYLHKGLHAEAIAEMQRARELDRDRPEPRGWLGYAYGIAGKRAEARQALAELQEIARQRAVDPGHVVRVYIGLDDKERALDWLERAYEDRSFLMLDLKVDPLFDPLRADPRFQDLLRRMNFPP